MAVKGEAVIPAGRATAVSAEIRRVKAYIDFAFDVLPIAARDMNLVTGLLSGASAVGGWKNASLSQKKFEEVKWYRGFNAAQRSDMWS